MTGDLNRSGGVAGRGPCSVSALILVLLAVGSIASAQPGLQPQIDQLIPSSVVAGSPDFILVIAGSNLTPAARVEWRTAGACADPTGFQELEISSAGQGAIEATVTAGLVAEAGTVKICVVKNPGGDRLPLTDSAQFSIVTLDIEKSHAGEFLVNATGAYTLTVGNSSELPTSGTVTVEDILPPGLAPASAAGSGWMCGISGQTVTCNRADGLAAGGSYSQITLQVQVTAAACPAVTNEAFVSLGGGTVGKGTDPTSISGCGPDVPDIDVAPLALDFGVVAVGAIETRTTTISNQGGTALSVTGLTLSGSGEFTLGAGAPATPFTVAPGASVVVPVNYTPTGPGADTGTLTIASNDPDEAVVNVALSGSGRPGPCPGIDVAPLALDFGAVAVGATETRTTTISNFCETDVSVTGLALSGSGEFALGVGAPATPFTVGPGASVVVPVNYTPSGPGADVGTLAITSNDPDEPIVSVALSGFGQSGPEIDVAPLALDFGAVAVGATETRTTTISNQGAANLSVTGLTLSGSGKFALAAGAPATPFSVAPGASVVVPVSYTPTGPGADTGTLAIASNDPDEAVVNVALSGFGQSGADPDIHVAPLALDFGAVAVGATGARTTTISNRGGTALSVTGLTLSGSGEFTLGAGAPATPFTVAPGASVVVPVNYTPTGPGADTGTLAIASNDPDEAVVNVALSGSGRPGPCPGIDVAPLALDFGAVAVGATDTRTTTINNFCETDVSVTGLTLSGSGDFALGAGAPATPFTVGPGASVVVPVNYTPSGPGADVDTLAITSNDPDEPIVSVALSGFGQSGPEIDVAPLALDFGAVAVGATETRTTTIRNLGVTDLSVTELTLSGGGEFALAAGAPATPFSVAPGASVVVPVNYTPTGPGADVGTLAITSNDPDEAVVNVALSGSGPAGLDPDIHVTPLALDFGVVAVGAIGTRTTTISNQGGTDLSVTGLTLSGGVQFALGAGTPATPFTVAPGASVVVPVNYTPSGPGADTSTLTVTSNDPDEPAVSVQLSGTTVGSGPGPTPPSALSITCNLPATTVGVASSGNLSVSGGKGPYTWEVIGGAAGLGDAGLSFSSSGGSTAKVTGCPTAEGTVGFTVRVTDSSSPKESATRGCSLQINPLAPTVGVKAVTRSRTRIDVSWTDPNPASGACASRQFSVERCQLPNGPCESLSAPESPGVGQISQPATPADNSCNANLCDSNLPDIGEPVTYRYEVKATSGGASSGPSFATATTLVVTPEKPADPTLLVPYSASVMTGGGASPYAWDGIWEVWNGAWQPCGAGASCKGLTFDSQGGISGVPVETGQLRLTASVSDANGATDSRQFEITIGEGAFELSPGDGLDFGRVAADSTSSPKSITVKSVGEGHPLAVGKASVSPESAYAIEENGCLELLPPGDSCHIGLVFSPSRLGRFNDSLTIPVNTIQKEKKVSLTGVGAVKAVTFEVKQEGREVEAGDAVDPSSQPTVQLHLDREYAEKLKVILTAGFEPGEVSNPTESGQGECPGAECCLPSGEPIYREVRFVQTGEVSQELDVGEETRFLAGTVAGRIRIDSQVVIDDPSERVDVSPPEGNSVGIEVNPDAPVISSATLPSRSANGFQMIVEGFSTPREVTEAVFAFTPASGGRVSFTSPAGLFGNEFAGWFANACSVDENMGSQFRLEANFTLQGSVDAIGTVSVKLRNRFGESNTVCVPFSTPCP